MKERTVVLALILILLFMSLSCKSPNAPSLIEDEYVPDYWEPEVKVIYNRDPDLIRWPEGGDGAMKIKYSLLDTLAEEHLMEFDKVDNPYYDERNIAGYRVGGCGSGAITKISENRYEAKLYNVQVHTKERYGDHSITVRDMKLHDGGSGFGSAETGKGITIEPTNSYIKVVIIAISIHEMTFRLIDTRIVVAKEKKGRGIF